ncbi:MULTISPECIES: Holliday junction branch migration protein RuvA [Pseudanabaena]|uniref:Holliday junction branch migration complex subunit RuvA n=2 Tax=Pseudanabaena TaxID=1152 RepID=L8N4Q4_9CYAN|nr:MULTISPECIES: Holliday junction branch migration protein RuvA [Pseudanabaena]ELS34114.1 Holliday junction DNA helicase subunit RuvA [Pseudanabaena biceps PCC 7429]MDG3493703.1 Holliday junction branch migration protein RuvA [Pseudanabaena catenata USMAC16]
MIGFLRGAIAACKAAESSRKNTPSYWLTLDVQGVGYDMQITASAAGRLPPVGQEAQMFTHLIVREDQMVLFGFPTLAERELFRQLISVSGIGTQVGLALLNSLGIQDLVKAIVSGNTRVLSLTPGVGTKTAERLALELKTKLADGRLAQVGTTRSLGSILSVALQEELEMTLLALGYTPTEISNALNAIVGLPVLAKTQDIEAWIKEAIAWLSR